MKARQKEIKDARQKEIEDARQKEEDAWRKEIEERQKEEDDRRKLEETRQKEEEEARQKEEEARLKEEEARLKEEEEKRKEEEFKERTRDAKQKEKEALTKEYKQMALEEESRYVPYVQKKDRLKEQPLKIQDFKTAKDYLEAMVSKTIKNSDGDSAGAHLFKDVKVEYMSKMMIDFRLEHIDGKCVQIGNPSIPLTAENYLPDQGHVEDLSDHIKQDQAENMKHDMKQQVKNLRINQGLNKQEFHEKMASIKDKDWKEI